MKKILPVLLAALLLSACPKEDDTPPPEPQQISDRAVGHYCSMNLTEHNGPKAQIYLNGKPDRPVWFSTIKQMFGYTKLPEEPKGIHVIYVTDMGKVKDWSKPNADAAWIDGKKAYYVIESGFIGGMGALFRSNLIHQVFRRPFRICRIKRQEKQIKLKSLTMF